MQSDLNEQSEVQIKSVEEIFHKHKLDGRAINWGWIHKNEKLQEILKEAKQLFPKEDIITYIRKSMLAEEARISDSLKDILPNSKPDKDGTSKAFNMRFERVTNWYLENIDKSKDSGEISR